jgi:hypothetical protein
VCVYILRDGGAEVSSWLKVEKTTFESDKVLTEDEESEALKVLFERFCKSDTHNELAAMGSRANSINFTEFELLLDELGVTPKKISTTEAARLFKIANRQVAWLPGAGWWAVALCCTWKGGPTGSQSRAVYAWQVRRDLW